MPKWCLYVDFKLTMGKQCKPCLKCTDSRFCPYFLTNVKTDELIYNRHTLYHIKNSIVDFTWKVDASHLNLDSWSVNVWGVCTYEYNSAQLEVNVGNGTEELQ